MASPYAISGSLSFGNVCTSFSNPQGAYTSAYQNYLSLNQQNYNNILSGYQQLSCALYASQGQIEQGYANLTNEVLCTIHGVDQSQLNAVQCTYTKQEGATQQQLINAGLGNSTVLGSEQAGNTQQEAQAQTAVTNQYAQTLAGYESNLGLAALNYQNQAAMQQAGLGSQALGFLAGINIPPPNACSYAKQYNANLARLYAGGGSASPVSPNRTPTGTSSPHLSGLPNIGCYGGGGGGGGTFIYCTGGGGGGGSGCAQWGAPYCGGNS